MRPTHFQDDLCKPKVLEMFETYKEAGHTFVQDTRPNHSVGYIQWDVLQANITATNPFAIIVALAGQQMPFFGYGFGDVIPLSGNAQYRATEAETNIATAHCTNNTDFAVEWIGVGHRGNKIEFATPNPFGDTDPKVLAAMLGRVPILDPFSYRMVAEGDSPALLECALFEKLLPFTTLRFEWDDGLTTKKVGVLDQFTQGGGASYLKAHGEPSSEGRVYVPEGYGWYRQGQAGSQFTARGILTQDVMAVISLGTNPATSAVVTPVHLYTEFLLRLGGVQFSTPSGN